MTMLDDLDRAARHPYAAGLAGSLVSLRFAPGDTWRARAVNVLLGSLTAAYVSPALTAWLRIDQPSLQAGAAFLLGLFGLSLASALMQAIASTPLGQILTGWLGRKGGTP